MSDILWLMRKNLNTVTLTIYSHEIVSLYKNYLGLNRHCYESKHEGNKMAQQSSVGQLATFKAWIDSRSRQLFVTTKWKLSRLRFAGPRHGKEKNQRRSLRYGLGFLLVPVNVERLKKNWSIGGRRPSAEGEKNWADIRLRFDCLFDLRRGYSERNPCSQKFSRR